MSGVAHFIDRFIPENYALYLNMNRSKKTFTGTVAITGEVLSESISLHQRDLDILSASLGVDGTPVSYEVDHGNEAVHLSGLPTGHQVVYLTFSGKITDNMTGMYPSYYTFNGEKKEVISTQFESHFAREVFPSIDEPEAKATFDLSMRFDEEEGDIALSNMPEKDPEKRKETGVWVFETTPRMSSYLLAFALGALHGKTTYTKNGTLVGVYGTQAQSLDAMDFSLNIATRVIEFYEDYFQVAYPIPQSLHVALPDFSSGAMENWGLVTYREVYLLVDNNSTVTSRQQVALVVAHEVAHQWFGNLVTMKWWDDLWLNESFANMMEYVAIEAIEPSWHIIEDFQTAGVPNALKRDATDGVQSVHVAVNHPDEINTLFDPAIVYAKGSRLMHMLRRWLGDTDFSSGLKVYFEKHQYQNTIGRDLWEALSHTSGKNVAAFMDSWLEQPGYPVVTVRVENDTLILRQDQFFIGEGSDQKRLWQIPLNTNWTGLPDTLGEREVVISGFSALAAQNAGNGAFRLNTDNTAHYITDYTGDLLDAILSDFSELDTMTKLQILQERRLLAEGGRISFADLLPLLDLCQGDSSYLVAEAVSQIIDSLKRFLDDGSSSEAALKGIVRELFQPDYSRLGFTPKEGESDADEMVRQIVVSHLLWADDPSVRADADSIFSQYATTTESIPAAMRGVTLANQMKYHETSDLVGQYLAAYVATNDSNFQRQLSQALSYITTPTNLDKIVVALKNKDIIKPQDLSLWYGVFLARSFAQETLWTWARDNWEWLKASLGGDMSFDKFVIIPSNIFKTANRLAEYRAFFEPQLDDMALSRNIAMGIKSIEARVAMIDKDKAAVEAAIEKSKKA